MYVLWVLLCGAEPAAARGAGERVGIRETEGARAIRAVLDVPLVLHHLKLATNLVLVLYANGRSDLFERRRQPLTNLEANELVNLSLLCRKRLAFCCGGLHVPSFSLS